MPVDGRDFIQIHRIQRAGLSKVRAAALEDGLTPERVDRDFGILRAVANGGTPAAANKFRVSRKTIWRALKKYEGYALNIINDGDNAGKGGTHGEL